MMPLVVTEQGPIIIKGSRLDSVIHHFKLGRQPSKLSKAFPLSASAAFTQVLLTTLHIARNGSVSGRAKK